MKTKAIIIDIDGTLSNCSHRTHHLDKDPKDWASFFKDAPNDHPNRWCIEIIKSMSITHEILFVTGRDDGEREKTTAWLHKHLWFLDHKEVSMALFMRRVGDRRDDKVVKSEIYVHQLEPFFDVLFAVDDKHSICRMWRELGVPALQCAHWEEDAAPNVHKEVSAYFIAEGEKK